MKSEYIVSACLVGINCKYNGGNNLNEKVLELLKQGRAIPVCPEQLGGLSTPRTTSERKGSKVFTMYGTDVTENFRMGAEKTLEIARSAGAKAAILKSKSPSCGSGLIYDGSFTEKLTSGDGITAELLKRNGIVVYTEKDFK